MIQGCMPALESLTQRASLVQTWRREADTAGGQDDGQDGGCNMGKSSRLQLRKGSFSLERSITAVSSDIRAPAAES